MIRTPPWAHDEGHVLIASPRSQSGVLTLGPDPDGDSSAVAARRMLARARAEERRRLSRLLHDDIGQSLTALNVKLAILRSKARGPARDDLGSAQAILEKSLNQLQRLSQDLHPSAVEDFGLVPALRSHIKSFSQKSALVIRFEADDLVQHADIELSLGVFRSIQALLTDLEVSSAARAVLCLDASPDALLLRADARIPARATKGKEAVPEMAAFHEEVLTAGGTVTFRAHRNQALICARFPMTTQKTL